MANSPPSVNSFAPHSPENDVPESVGSNHFFSVHLRFANSPILLEKGLNFLEDDQWGRRLVKGFGWKKFIKAPSGRVNISVVREFYSSLILTPFVEPTQLVVVRGVAVPFSYTLINEIFGMAPVNMTHFEVQWELHNVENVVNRKSEALQCLFPYYELNRDTSASALLPHLRAWKRFINSRVYPTEDFEVITDEEMLLLYALAYGAYVNWGILIHRSTLMFAVDRDSRGRPMPFSWMISRLCVQMSGVMELDSDEFFPAKGNRVGLLPVDTPGCSSSV